MCLQAQAVASRRSASSVHAEDSSTSQIAAPVRQDEEDDDIGDRGGPEAIETFTRLMRERFLDGHDHRYVDYNDIDSDLDLDERWAREIALDAEERYFDADQVFQGTRARQLRVSTTMILLLVRNSTRWHASCLTDVFH
eukprot:TRINITY_DN16988_c0_g1_i2.p1 TRINITY_DN16988_c0_g1~~TRINITY_DN16988_c0_g1_i2.p1  ORF type:complete len:139 (-),score=12.16 TRINITY_DN16988_c0_g1_i2:48-464(-)